MPRLNDSAEVTTSSRLSRLTLLLTVDDDVKAVRTVAAALPVRSKRSISSLAKSLPSFRGASAEYRIISGINALNAWAESAIARSRPCTLRKRSNHDRANSIAAAIIHADA